MVISSAPLVSWEKALPNPGIVIILGHRGQGKSALAWWLLENVHKRRSLKAVVVGMPRSKRGLVPDWVEHTENIGKLPEGAVVLLDEAALRFSARRSQTDTNLAVAGLVALSRQRKQVIILVCHTARMLDVELIFDSDLVVYKMPSMAHVRFERKETASFTQKAREALLKVDNPKKWAYVIDFHGGREGLLKNGMPSFWSENLSNVYAGLDVAKLVATPNGRAETLFKGVSR